MVDLRGSLNEIRKGELAKYAKFQKGTRSSPIAQGILDDEEFIAEVIFDVDAITTKLKKVL